MTAYCTTVAPFRIAEGEGTPERCAPANADGWEAFRDGGRRYFYKTKREACAASERLEVGGFPVGGYPFWARGCIAL